MEVTGAIADIIHSLVTRGRTTHFDGKEEDFSSTAPKKGADSLRAPKPDILFINRYSAQAERSEFAFGARIKRPDAIDLCPYGRIQTVDKARGDEAHGEIYSVTRASVEDSPRGRLHCLRQSFQCRRLPCSRPCRRRGLAVVAASPKLLDADPTNQNI